MLVIFATKIGISNENLFIVSNNFMYYIASTPKPLKGTKPFKFVLFYSIFYKSYGFTLQLLEIFYNVIKTLKSF